MGLKGRVVLAVNALVIISCVIMGILGYKSAQSGFSQALEMKADADVKSLSELLNYRYEGDWNLRDGYLYKGATKIDDADEIVDSLAQVTGGKITIFKGDTRVVTNVKDESGKRQTGTKASQAVIDNVLTKGEKFLGTANVMGEEHHAAYVPLKDAAGKIIGMLFVGVSVHEMDGVVQSLIMSIILALAAIVVGCVVLSNVFVGKLLGALEKVVDVTKKIAGGDLRIDDLEIKSNDEIGALSSSINDMKNKLKVLLRNIAETSERVAASAQELTAATHEGKSSIDMMAQNTVDLTEQTDQQNDTVAALQQTMQNMSEKMAALYEGAMDMDLVAAESAQSTVDGQEKISVAIDVMKSITEQVHSSVQVVGNLGKRSDEIGEIVKTISEIADQTNLLALNAAIEAARAGEHGRGFAVVADEVRKLAEQSSVAAANISALIASIQKDTASAVETISHGNEGVKDGMDSVMATDAAFKNIGKQVEKLAMNVVDSMVKIEEVNTCNDEINQAVSRTQEITHKSSENATSLSAAAEEQTAMINEIAEASKSLAEFASDMQSEVAKFKL